MGQHCPPVARGRPSSGNNRKRPSTGRHRGGPARSSDEGPVMGLEPREPGRSGRQEANPQGEEPPGGPKQQVKSFDIPKRLVGEAWEKVLANGGAPGVDAASIADFAADEASNLYKLCCATNAREERDLDLSNAVPVMGDGPPGSPCRGRSQTTAWGVGKEPGS